MDQVELQQKIAEYFVKLKPKAQEAFSAMKWLETLRTISQKYNLNEAQIESLGTETTLVLLGILNMADYEKNLITDLSLPDEKEDALLEEINTFILNPIRPELSHAFDVNVGNISSEVKDIMGEAKNFENKKIEVVQNMDPRFKKLPNDLQKIIKDSNYQPKLYKVGKENGLTVSQISSLEEIITKTILGEINPEDFEDVLSKTLNLTPEKNKIIINAINEQVLREIRSELMHTYSKNNIHISSEEETILKNAGFEIQKVNIQAAHPKQKEDISIKAGELLLKDNGINIEKENITEPRDIISESPKEMLADIENTDLIKGYKSLTPKKITEEKTTPKEDEKIVETRPVLSLISQKMNGDFQIPSSKTEYNNSTILNPVPQNQLLKKDPYRLSPEE